MTNRIVFLFICLFVFSSIVRGQDKKSTENTSFKKVINFEKKTGTKEVVINIEKQTPALDLLITGKISSGKLNVAVIDPQGTSVKQFRTKARGFDKNKGVSIGKISYFQPEPLMGKWIVKISTAKAWGKIKIQADFNNDYNIKLPRNFTPDDKGENDILKLDTYNISEINSFEIYNLWGERVFSTKNINTGWDGKYNNELQSPGNYFYVVKAKTNTGKEVEKSGYFFLCFIKK